MALEFSKEYRDYVKSPKWKLVCQRYWHTYGRKCQACGSRKSLQVHHKSYDRFGRELLTDLCGLCYSCHRLVHQTHRANRSVSLRLVTERFVLSKRMEK